MSHYTANLRDLEFNLFEFLDTKDRFGTGPFEQMDADTARGVLTEIRRLAEGPIAASFVDADRNPPVFDPATNSVTLPESFKKSVQALNDGEWYRLDLPEHLGGFGAPHALTWAAFEMVLGANPAVFMYGSGSAFAAILDEVGNDGAEAPRPDHARQGLGRHDGAHRARRRLRRGRRHHQGRAAGRRLVAHHRREALHHLGRARPERQHHPPGPGPPRGREAGHQGAVAVRRPQVPLRRADRRARRAQRRLRDQRREEDGPEGLHDLRAHLRRRRRAGPGLAGRRRARRHRPDVQGDRARPHVRGREGDRHAVGRLPGRPRLREEPRPGRRPDRDHQGRPAGSHHPPPRRAPLADDPEGLRRGHAGALPLHRELPRPGHRGRGRGHRPTASRRSWRPGSTTCCCRS